MTRAHRSLLILTALTVLALGTLADGLARSAGIGADVQVAASAVLLIVSALLLVRVLRYLTTGQPGRVRTTRQRRRRSA
ncbi:hypothetical protein [Amycolatopsis sp. NPDC059657]|uniref:hypothetical protein n=1 Tax=Amycolatopsis sp. NPDC059657 TaxID=3346899 RepID=UPI00366E1781